MNNQVKEIVFTGPDGKLVGKFSKKKDLPIYETRVKGGFIQVKI